mgnify:CR=1 FL=1
MGTKLSRCLGLQSYIQVQEDLNAHPGQSKRERIIIDTSDNIEQYYDENTEALFSDSTAV